MGRLVCGRWHQSGPIHSLCLANVTGFKNRLLCWGSTPSTWAPRPATTIYYELVFFKQSRLLSRSNIGTVAQNRPSRLAMPPYEWGS